jgi:integrase
MQFTKSSINGLALPAGKTDHIEWDDEVPGFGLRLRGDTRRWICQYRVGRQQRRESLGDPRKVSLDDARRIARQRFAQVELGTDPAADRAKARAAAAATKLTLAVVSERYLDARKSMMRPSTYTAAVRNFKMHWAPLRDQPIESIRRVDVAARLGEIAKASGPIAAARARATLAALYAWAMREGLYEGNNPVTGTNNPSEGAKPRDRVLSDQELRAVWNACGNDDFGRIVRLLILTGCRRREIGGLQWNEINLDTGVMTIAGSRTKNHRTLQLTLPSVALDILRSAPRRDGHAHVFGKQNPFSAWSYSVMALDRRIARAEGKSLADWSLHDLRRTLRTGLGRLGVAPHVAELVLNHVRGGIEAVYDRHRYQPEIKAALVLWAGHVMAIIEGRPATVVPLKQTA